MPHRRICSCKSFTFLLEIVVRKESGNRQGGLPKPDWAELGLGRRHSGAAITGPEHRGRKVPNRSCLCGAHCLSTEPQKPSFATSTDLVYACVADSITASTPPPRPLTPTPSATAGWVLPGALGIHQKLAHLQIIKKKKDKKHVQEKPESVAILPVTKKKTTHTHTTTTTT